MGYRYSYDKETKEGPKLLAEFDPSKKKLPRPKSATFAPFRQPQWKTYSNVGHAKTAMGHHRFIIRYEWDDGHPLAGEGAGWVEVERRESTRRYE